MCVYIYIYYIYVRLYIYNIEEAWMNLVRVQQYSFRIGQDPSEGFEV